MNNRRNRRPRPMKRPRLSPEECEARLKEIAAATPTVMVKAADLETGQVRCNSRGEHCLPIVKVTRTAGTVVLVLYANATQEIFQKDEPVWIRSR